MADASRFAHLVSLACHDLRTPLATVHGFARTLERVELADPAPRYVEMIGRASEQMTELLEELALVARIEAGRFDPTILESDSLEIAEAAVAELEDERATVGGEGAPVRVEPESTRRALRQLARAAKRHGGVDSISVTVRRGDVEIAPITPSAVRVVTGEDLRELGPAVAIAVVEALGGSVRVEGETLVVRLPLARGQTAY
ncbi:MAG: HAMP domain-containing histidine kinase [Actinobacteria bacterium]|nr:HAMP domain-containing histidine kinase [Actinomycetota bacterium]